MTARSSRRVVLLIAFGFVLLALLIWVNELVDTPHHLFRAAKSAHRFEEALLEGALVLLLGVLIVTWARRIVRRVDYLERFVKLCSWCRRVQLGEEWLQVEAFLGRHAKETTHGMCPECLAKFESEQLTS